MSTPSLLNIPYVIKAGTLYSQIPETGAGDFTVTRATTPTANRSTRVNANGFIELVNDGVPRLDYFASGGVVGCPAALIEASGQNLAFQSQAFDVSGNWTQSNVTVTPNVTATLDPAGGNTADLLADSVTTGSTSHRIYTTPVPASAGSISVVSGTTYSTSLFVKAGTSSVLRIVLRRDNEAVIGIGDTIFNVTSGTITSGSGTIENYGNGWYRCTNIGTSNFTGGARIFINLYDTAGNQSYIGTAGTNNMYIWGAQLETGSVATSYIPTTSGSVTRNADVISVTGAVSGCIGQTEGTIYAEVDIRNAISRVASILQLRQDANNQITVGITTAFGGTNTIAVRGQQAGTFVIGLNQQNNAAGIYKIAFAYKSTDCKLYINGTDTGVTITVNNAFTAFSFNEIQLGMNNSANQFNDRIRAVALYTTRLTNAQLAALTT
jgi:hypothetical protein